MFAFFLCPTCYTMKPFWIAPREVKGITTPSYNRRRFSIRILFIRLLLAFELTSIFIEAIPYELAQAVTSNMWRFFSF